MGWDTLSIEGNKMSAGGCKRDGSSLHPFCTLSGSNVEHWHDVDDESPLFVGKAAHEPDKHETGGE